ncbi:sulfide-dependent adenosine diphosphate thiazole synthase [Candidatus Aminicenantes bacterium AC-334-K16]|jgi:thiamine thiazole synthase|nr:sulfide-dependent adenosine diphosphate thiazole synthase [Candidatus Aminicenantes bacterium AC-334-K16]
MLDDIIISRAITEEYFKEFLDSLESDVVIVGAGPAGLCAAYNLAREGFKVVVFERTLRPGGGVPGGGMMFNKVVVQEDSKPILDELGVNLKKYQENYYVAAALEMLGALLFQSIREGVRIFNCISVEDVLIYEKRVAGVVINWSAAEAAGLHVDPLTARAEFVVDATGHAAEIAEIVSRKSGGKLFTSTGKIIGERPMWAEVGEKVLLVNTKEVYPHLYVCGMAANAVFGGPRMGPVFGGMLLSGQKVAQLLTSRLKKKD